VIHAVRKIQDEILNDNELARDVDVLRRSLGG
jgi:chromosomal replication initiation ATPase DnaA